MHKVMRTIRFILRRQLTSQVLLVLSFVSAFIATAFISTAFAAAPAEFHVVIDPGHGGADLGARYGGIFEKDLVQQISKQLKQELSETAGIVITMTRDEDTTLSLEERVQLSHDSVPNLFLSIHANASESSKRKGAEFYIRNFVQLPNSEESAKETELETILKELHTNGQLLQTYRFSQNLKNLWPITPRKNSIRQAPFYVLTKNQGTPSILIEIGYLSHPAERKRLKDAQVQKQIVAAIKQTLLNLKDKIQNRSVSPP